LKRTAAVIVSSDRAHAGTYVDESGPAVRAWLEDQGYEVASLTVVADEPADLNGAILGAKGIDLIITSGGTGISPRDVTPQTLDAICDYSIPGIGELLRAGSLKYSLNAYLSRCGGWVKDGSLILALPGNPKAVVEQLGIISDLLPHAVSAVKGKCGHRRKTETTEATIEA